MDFQKIETLVFAGGGIRGLAFVGALQELRDTKGVDFGAKNPNLKNVVGVSVGTLFALMICLGMSVAEITETASKMKQSDIMDADPMKLLQGELFLDSGDKLKTKVESLFTKKGVLPNVTFSQLFSLTRISLHVMVTDITNAQVVHINEITYPDLSVSSAMIASMSLPLVYAPVKSPEGHLWLDGGILENFPITRFDPETLMGFDFKISTECKFVTLLDYITRILYVQSVPLEVAAWKLMSDAHQKRCIMIDTGTVSTLRNLNDLSSEMRFSLLKAGREAMQEKIFEWDNERERDKTKDPWYGKIGLPSFLSALTTCNPPSCAYDKNE